MIAALLLASSLAAAPNPPASVEVRRFQEAGAAYEKGRFADALAGYERIAAADRMSGPLAYNLGNTHWRLGRRGFAIRWWELARRLDPRDSDIRYNLALARSALQDEEPGVWETLDRVLTVNELAVLVTCLVWLLAVFAGLALWRDVPWNRWRRFIWTGLPLLVVLAVWLALRAADLARPWGVVTAPTVEIRSGPGDQFPVGYSAPEGQRILLLSRRPGWVEIGVPSRSLKGWVVDTAVTGL
jgi:tetratricopeptide (TPR) repeat protein